MIRVGDRVKFISDTYVGEVTKINGTMADVAVEDGFVVPALLNDLVVVNKEDEMYAIRRIGVSDERPGTNKGSRQKEEKKPVARREAAYARYGRVSLVEDYEDDEDIVDLNTIREQYTKSVAAINNRELAEAEKEALKSRSWEEVKEPVNDESVFEVPEKPKMKSVELEKLDEALKVEFKKDVAPPKPKPQKKENEPEIIDLHADEILDSTAGMTPGEIITAQISRFNIALSLAVKSGSHGKIVFIHGVGSGKLKYELEKELRRNYSKLSYQDASFKEYGYGAIMIFY